ncbi:MAG: hypothetical protein HUU50_07905 [Candidatus Brocadiae bacterium]|nr:hypothetical protein [Candidatus Brocadiia bacterium]
MNPKIFLLILFICFFSSFATAVPFTDKNGEEEAGPDLAFISKPTEFLCYDAESRFDDFLPQNYFHGEKRL